MKWYEQYRLEFHQRCHMKLMKYFFFHEEEKRVRWNENPELTPWLLSYSQASLFPFSVWVPFIINYEYECSTFISLYYEAHEKGSLSMCYSMKREVFLWQCGHSVHKRSRWNFIYFIFILFYYESRKRELKTRVIYEDWCDERLKN